jgi:hypothetical protein
MVDPELDRAIREELLEKSLRVGLKLAALAEQLARSLDNAAQSFERLAHVPVAAAARRNEFRRAECPGRFD